MQHRLVFKKCGPDGQWVRGPGGQSWRNASQCQMDDHEIEVQVSLQQGQQEPGAGGRVQGLPALNGPALCRRRWPSCTAASG